ncbi:tetratricopeptide repeat protein [Thalassobellus citreus]|uniref:tetratricopeptide repeat protein n=1 Tax=Thalassobellus citreus TaxID=3367752 RepID=UPI00379EA55D
MRDISIGNNINNTVSALMNMGSVYTEMKDYKSALINLNEAKALLINSDNVHFKGILEIEFSRYYSKINNNTDALKHALKAYEIANNNNLAILKNEILEQLGDVYFAHKDYVKSKNNYLKALEGSKENKSKQSENNLYKSCHWSICKMAIMKNQIII